MESLELSIPHSTSFNGSNGVQDAMLIDTFSAGPGSKQDHVGQTRRVVSEMRSHFEEIRQICHRLRRLQPRDVTTAGLKEMTDDMAQRLGLCEDVLTVLPARVAELTIDSVKGKLHGSALAGPMSRKSFASTVRRAANQVSTTLVVPNLSMSVPTMPSTPRMSTTTGSGGALSSTVFSRLPTNMLPDIPGRTATTLAQPSEAASEKMMNLARGLYLVVEGAARAIGAEKALLCVPNRGIKEDLRVVSYCGFNATAPEHRSKDAKSVEYGVLCSKFLVNCASGNSPPHEVDYDGVLQYFHDAMAEEKPQPPGGVKRGENALNRSVTSSLNFISNQASEKSRRAAYWSKLYCPVRRDASSAPCGVLAFLQKDRGTANFNSDDEHIAFGASVIVAGMLQRCGDYELLARCSDQIGSSVPALVTPHVQGLATCGIRQQQVYRTGEMALQKDIKILTGESGTAAERLDDHTPLLAISGYIVRLQESWRNAVLLNASLTKTHEDRTKVVTALLARARVSEFRTEAMMAERVAAIPLSRKPLFERGGPKPPKLQGPKSTPQLTFASTADNLSCTGTTLELDELMLSKPASPVVPPDAAPQSPEGEAVIGDVDDFFEEVGDDGEEEEEAEEGSEEEEEEEALAAARLKSRLKSMRRKSVNPSDKAKNILFDSPTKDLSGTNMTEQRIAQILKQAEDDAGRAGGARTASTERDRDSPDATHDGPV